MKKCEICGRSEKEIRVIDSEKFNRKLCSKHYHQMQEYGKIFKRTIKDPNEIVKHKNYAEIILYNSSCEEIARAKIDLEDVDKVKGFKWYLKWKRKYVLMKNKNNRIRLHRFIMDCPENMEVDHINNDPLDNRKENLRICTHEQNAKNRSLSSNNKSGCSGVYFHKKRDRWYSQITFNGNKIYLGCFKNKQDAIKVRKEAEKKYFGEFRYDWDGV